MEQLSEIFNLLGGAVTSVVLPLLGVLLFYDSRKRSEAAKAKLAEAYQQHAEDMHGRTYLLPRPGTDWCRLTDFVGYDHNAVPTLNGMYTGGNPCYYNAERNFTVSIMYSKSSNTTGVDIGDMLPESVAEDIGILPNPAGSAPTSVSGSVSYIDSSGVGHPVSSFNVTLS